MLLNVYTNFSAGGIYCRDMYTISLPQRITDKTETWFYHEEEVDFLRFRFQTPTKMPKQVFVFNLTNRKIYRYKFYMEFENETPEGDLCDFTYCYQRWNEYTLVGELTQEYRWVYCGLDTIYLKYAEIKKLLENYEETFYYFK